MNKKIYHMQLAAFLVLIMISVSARSQNFGNADHPMNKGTENIEILKFWNKASPEELKLYEIAEQVLSSQRDANYKDLTSNPKFMQLCEAYQVWILGGPLLGNVSSGGVSIWVRTLVPSKIEVHVSDGNNTYRSKPVSSQLETDLTAIIEIDNLEPSTSYAYKLMINDTIEIANHNYSFKTLPAEEEHSEVRISFGSCSHRWGLGNELLFNTISSGNPASMLLLGDIAVQDRENHIGMHRADYLLRDMHAAWKNFVCRVPVYASWDDHDYFNNDDAGIPEGYTNEDREKVRQVYANSWNNPSYGFGEEGKGIFFRTRIGPADVMMTDNRYFRTGEKGSFLGKQQMNWLKQQLLDCKGPFIIISCGTMWSDYVSNGKDSWGVNDPEGREELFQFIEDNNISGVLLISGDRHGARGFTIPRESGFEFYEFGAASLGSRAAAQGTIGKWDTELYGVVNVFAFGEFTFRTSGSEPQVTFRLIKEGGDVLSERTITLGELTPSNFNKESARRDGNWKEKNTPFN